MAKKYSVDEDFFSQIDTSHKAYVLGFIWGDGSVDKNYSMLRIEISSKDEEILDKIRASMNSTHKIYRRSRVRNSTTTFSSTLVIGRQIIVSDLAKLGLRNNKNESLSMPHIPSKFHFDFIRGLYDSDGHVGIDNKNRVRCSLISTTNLCRSVQKIFANSGVSSKLVETDYSALSRLVIHNKSDVLALREILYKDASIFLSRKKLIFDKVHYKGAPDFSGSNNPFFGKVHSEKTKKTLSLANRGSNCGNSKLKEDDVLFIKKHPDLKTSDVSTMFNISPGTVRSIRRGDTWSHVRVKEVNHG